MVEIGLLSWLDVAVIVLLFAGITYFGHRLSGTVKDREGFFKADSALPWAVVSASIIATSHSSLSYIGIPAMVFREGGDLTYAQAVFGFMIGMILLGFVFARPYYECKEASTTYDYIALRLDRKVGQFSMFLGILLTSLEVGVQLLSSALVISVITGESIAMSVLLVVGFAVLWSWMAGLKTVIWTDMALFVVFSSGALFSAIWLFFGMDVSVTEAIKVLDDKAKLVIVDLSTDPAKRFTLWAALLGAPMYYLTLAGYQSTMQRIRACRSARAAQKAYIFAACLYAVPFLLLVVGLGLSIFYHTHELPQDLAATLQSEPDRIFPYFIATELPAGVSSFVIAAILAAGISTLDSRITELSDVVISDIYQRYIVKFADEAHYLLASRWAVVLWGIAYALFAIYLDNFKGEGLLNLVLTVGSYLTSSILGILILARIGVGTWKTCLLGLVASLGATAFLAYHDVGFFWWTTIPAALMIVIVWLTSGEEPEWEGIKVIEERVN